jgi:hypothetical protein
VVGLHNSKSIDLPVYKIEYNDKIFYLRNNFYNWIVSVISETPIEIKLLEKFDKDNTIPHVYCEGFKKEWVFGKYKDNHKQFTFLINCNYDLYVLFWLIKELTV